MMRHEYLLYLYAESPVHAGAADGEDVLDLPVQRETSTGYPVIWGQSLKGAIRQAAPDAGWATELVTKVFGPPVDGTNKSGLKAGWLSVGDAQLVAMPVATLERTFAWITTGPALARLARKYKRLDLATATVPSCPSDGVVAVGAPWIGSRHVVLGPCVTSVATAPDANLSTWGQRIADDAIGTGQGLEPFADKLRRDMLLVGDALATPLLKECTEVAVRVQLGEGKTVKNGPFHTEYLPTETVLAAALTLRCPDGDDDTPKALGGLLHGQLHQVGGDETLGKGLVWCSLLPWPGTERES